MKTPTLRLGFALGLFIGGFGTAAMTQPAPPPSPVNVNILALKLPPGLSHAVVRQALVTSFTQRGWTVVSVDDEVVVGHLLHRGIDANLTLRYDVNRVEFDSDSYKIDGAGHRTTPTVPTGWIQNLEKDIPRYASQAK